MELDDLIRFKKKIESTQKEVDKTEGAIEHLMKQLSEGYSCSTLKEAKVLVDKMRKDMQSESDGIEEEITKLKAKVENATDATE